MDETCALETLNLKDRRKSRHRKVSRIFSRLPFRIHSFNAKDRFPGILLQKGQFFSKIGKQLHDRTDFLDMTWGKEPFCKSKKRLNTTISQTEAYLKSDDEPFYKPGIPAELNVYHPNEFEKKSFLQALLVYLSWAVLLVYAHFREFLKNHGLESNRAATELPKQKDFPPLYDGLMPIYTHHCYMRVRDVFERPIGSVPGATVKLLDRFTTDHCWTFKFTGTQTEVINMGSYNYLGFAEKAGPCADAAATIIDKQGISTCSTIMTAGCSKVHHDLERLVARFIGAEDAICFSMGYATNSMNIVCLADKDSLIVSDEHNHTSLILGSRLTGAKINIFKHDDMEDLERVLRNAIAYGNLVTRRPYKKILIIVEGIYSMEGSICNLPKIIELKKKYKAYLYLDEAHSIGALGPTGRGVVEYWGCNPRDVDIMMGTFTKSFGASGGYIAGLKKTIDHIRTHSHTGFYSLPMSPPIAKQVYTSMSILMGLDASNEGHKRIEQLARNTRYFRRHLKRMGFLVYGSDDSPVVPVLLYYPTKCGLWGRETLKRRIAVVVVSYPATAMTESRVRICLSAAHTKEMLDKTLETMREVGELTNVFYSRHRPNIKASDIAW